MQFFSVEFSPGRGHSFKCVMRAGLAIARTLRILKHSLGLLYIVDQVLVQGAAYAVEYSILRCSQLLFSLHRYLQQCGIAQIEKRAFKDLQSLNGLHLSHNNILELFPNAFRDLLMKDL